MKNKLNNRLFYITEYNSPIGKLSIFSDGINIVEIRLPKTRFPMLDEKSAIKMNKLEAFKLVRTWLDSYFAKQNPSPNDLPLKFFGSDFQCKVMTLLREIPYGTVTTYKDIARKISPKMSAQAVGNAVGHNPLCIVVPCHRVIGKNNNLVGFGGGLDAKKFLLSHEGVDLSKFKTPTKGNAL